MSRPLTDLAEPPPSGAAVPEWAPVSHEPRALRLTQQDPSSPRGATRTSRRRLAALVALAIICAAVAFVVLRHHAAAPSASRHVSVWTQ